MKINILTLFPEMFTAFFSSSMVGRAVENGILRHSILNIRDFSQDKHRRTDDYPFGGGAGMVMMCQPVFDCFRSIESEDNERCLNIYMSPAGQPLTQKLAQELAEYDQLNVLCGHYEGVDERIVEQFIDLEVSIGDYVLTGGELPAMILVDCVARFVPGVLGNDESARDESFSEGLLEYPQYTRPAVYEDREVPEVLLSGHHANIEKWRKLCAKERTALRRPDLMRKKSEKNT